MDPKSQLNKTLLIVFLLLPIGVLLFQVTGHEIDRNKGQRVHFLVEGYDPRDILSGHYLTYSVNYQNAGECSDTSGAEERDVILCIQDKQKIPRNMRFCEPGQNDKSCACHLKIKGRCSYKTFTAGIEKYYIPESKAALLDQQIRKEGAIIEVSVTPQGRAYLMDLYFPDK